jgi:hypothetical protein
MQTETIKTSVILNVKSPLRGPKMLCRQTQKGAELLLFLNKENLQNWHLEC